MEQKKNQTLELLKLLAAYMVVFIHVPFYGVFGSTANALARFAVPLFFLVSGFFSYNITPKKIGKRILHIFSLMIFAILLYEVYKTVLFLGRGDPQGLAEYFSIYTDPVMWVKLFTLNQPFHGNYIWYLPALIYVYFSHYLCIVLKIKDKVIFIVSFVLLVIHIILAEGLLIFDFRIPESVIRNFLLMGLPFYGMGLMARKYEERLQRTPMPVAMGILVFGIAATLLSRMFIGKNELYLGSVFVLIALVIVFIRFKDVKYPKALTELAECSTYIYIMHILVRDTLLILYPLCGLDYGSSVSLQMLHPLAVCLITTVFAYLFILMLRLIHTMKKPKAEKA